ncbi:MAG: hypothetical protein OXU23_08790 [Candidatus Poribacteria bacterium]|nr:hypothetical protein [Candidatus Poribacteria bacterium]
MKSVILSTILCVLFVFSAKSDFLPEDNSDTYGLKYGESIAGMPPSTPKIDGKLNDWQYAVWVAFDSEKELLRGKGIWKGKDDLTMTWSTMYDEDTFYFAAAVRDDEFTPAANPAESWKGDTIFLYIDWEKVGAGQPACKPNFALIKNKAHITDYSAVKNADLPNSDIAIVPTPELGKGGMIYEVAMPFKWLTKVKIEQGDEVGFTPGYEEGVDDLEKKGGLVFMDWHGLNQTIQQILAYLSFKDRLLLIQLANWQFRGDN